MKEIKIYVGLNDRETKEQKFTSDRYIKVLKEVCFNYHTPFSFVLHEGGYFHENGDYVQENTIVLSLIDVDMDVANEIAKDLCVFFNQESVLVTTGNVEKHFISEQIK